MTQDTPTVEEINEVDVIVERYVLSGAIIADASRIKEDIEDLVEEREAKAYEEGVKEERERWEASQGCNYSN